MAIWVGVFWSACQSWMDNRQYGVDEIDKRASLAGGEDGLLSALLDQCQCAPNPDRELAASDKPTDDPSRRTIGIANQQRP